MFELSKQSFPYKNEFGEHSNPTSNSMQQYTLDKSFDELVE